MPSRRQFHQWSLAAGALATVRSTFAHDTPLRPIELTVIDDQTLHGATFQSNTQHVVANRHGVFCAYIKTRNEAYDAQNWRLVRTTDSGKTFSLVAEGIDATNPPVLETDGEGNVYLCRVDWKNRRTSIDLLSAATGFSRSKTLVIDHAAGGKFAMAVDRRRGQVCFITLNGVFHRVDLDGKQAKPLPLLGRGERAVLQYPTLQFDERGDLYFTWTTVAHGKYLYYDIHAIRSTDGGDRWETLAGRGLTPPLAADDSGPADTITAQGEEEFSTWLASSLSRHGKLHAIYETHSNPRRYNYVRIDTRSGREDVRISPRFGGKTLSLRGLDGGLASRANDPTAPLFAVVRDADKTRIACLRSDDQGNSWRDWAVAEATVAPYAIGVCREITEDGHVVGTYTDAIEPSNNPVGKSKVYFFRIAVG